MNDKIDINLNMKSEIKNNFAFLSFTVQKMKFSIKDFFFRFLVTFIEEILNGKLYIFCAVYHMSFRESYLSL